MEQVRGNDSQPDIHVTDPNNHSTSELASKEAVVQISSEEDVEVEEDWTSVGTSVRNIKVGNSGRVELMFDIEFERLGLTLPNGTPILQVQRLFLFAFHHLACIQSVLHIFSSTSN